MTYYPISPKPSQSNEMVNAKERRKKQLALVRKRRAVVYKKFEEKMNKKSPRPGNS